MTRKKLQRDSNEPHPKMWQQRWLLVTVANVLTWASFPPLGWFPLAWLAVVVWVHLIQDKSKLSRRDYWSIWAISALTWGILLEGVGRAFWANYIGLVFMGAYLGVYNVLFLWLTRSAVRRWKLSVVIAAPAVWTGLELVRGYMITGFSMALLGHTQVCMTPLIQIADTFGAYGVSFLVMFVGACLARSLPMQTTRWTWWPIVAGLGVLCATIIYGQVRMKELDEASASGKLKVALIQGTEDTILDSDVEAARRRATDTFNQYWRLTLDVRAKHDDLDVIVWPEGVFSANTPQWVSDETVLPPEGTDLTSEDVEQIIRERQGLFDTKTQAIAAAINRDPVTGAPSLHPTHFIAGADAVALSGTSQKHYNSAFFIDPKGNVAARYDKMHRVLIGEYVPYGEQFPWLYNLMPLPRGFTAGEKPQPFVVNNVVVSPSICFEDTVPHLIRSQVRELSRTGEEPDMLINLTNDGWFWGSSILDLQLTCAIFRAVELRRPTLVAANTGLTAVIDSNGSVVDTLPRRVEGAVVAEVPIQKRFSWYERLGDVFAGACLIFCLAVFIAGFVRTGNVRHDCSSAA